MARRWTWWLLPALAAGCGEVLGIDDFEYVDGPSSGATSSSSSSTSSSASTSVSVGGGGAGAAGGAGVGAGGAGAGSGGEGTCDLATHACVAETPPDWTGPIALHTGPGTDPPTACAGGYATAVGEFHTGFVPGTATCHCQCGAAQNIQCTASATVCYASANCFSAICNTVDATLPPTQCTSITSSSDQYAYVSDPAPANAGACVAQSNHDLPTPTWSTDLTACGGAAVAKDDCGDGQVCAPLPADPFQQMCIHRDGDVDCPDGFYTDKLVAYGDFTDDRACSTCGCGTADSQCGGTVVFTQSNCSVLLKTVGAGDCGLKNLNSNVPTFAKYQPMPSGTCQPTGGVLSGSAAQTEPITFCCAP